MARKHERFSYNYGWRTAPEQWRFYLNGKYIPLDANTRSVLACMCLSGKVDEAEAELKRVLRKDEKRPRVIGKCICFFQKGADDFYYTQQLMYNPDDLQEALWCYKKWKRYIQSKDCMLETGYVITEGVLSGEEETTQKAVACEVDLTRCRSIKVVRESIFD